MLGLITFAMGHLRREYTILLQFECRRALQAKLAIERKVDFLDLLFFFFFLRCLSICNANSRLSRKLLQQLENHA